MSDAYLEPSLISKIKLFAKKNIGSILSTIFAKSSILDIFERALNMSPDVLYLAIFEKKNEISKAYYILRKI